MDEKSKKLVLGLVVLVVGYKMTTRSIDRSIDKLFKKDPTPGVVVDEGDFWDGSSWQIENNSGVFTAWIRDPRAKATFFVSVRNTDGPSVTMRSLEAAHRLISRIDSGEINIIWDMTTAVYGLPTISTSDVARI